MDYHRATLSGGLRVLHVPMLQMHSVSIVVYIGVGSRYESDIDAGTSHLIEHMLFKGTKRRPRARDISQTIESVGGVLNASTDKELTVFWSKTAREHAPLAIDLLADMLRDSRLRPADVAREKNIVCEELAMLADDPQDWVHVLTDEVLWPCHPLGREIAGSRESVSSIPRRTLVRHLQQFYGPNNAVISVAGGLDTDKVMQLIERSFDGWQHVTPMSPVPAVASPNGSRSRLEGRPIEHVNLCLAFPGFARDHPDRWTLDVLCTILGGGTSSRLFVELRERLGLVYDVHMYTSHFGDSGSIVVYAGTDPAQSTRGLDAIMHEIDRIRTRGITKDELWRAQQFFRGRLALGLEDTHSVASWFGSQEILKHEVITPEEAVAAVEAVTTRDVKRVAQEYLRPESSLLAAVGPPAGLDLKLPAA